MPTELRPHFPAALDTVLQTPSAKAARILKLALLTAPKIAISDVQALDSIALRKLLPTASFKKFISIQESDQRPALFAVVRNPGSFEEILKSFVIDRPQPLFFSSFPFQLNAEIFRIYGRESKPHSLQPFYSACDHFDIDYREHIRLLEHYIVKVLTAKSFQYSDALLRAAEENAPRLKRQMEYAARHYEAQFISLAEQKYALCCRIGEMATRKPQRSDVYRFINEAKPMKLASEWLKREILDWPYNMTYASINSFHAITGSEHSWESLRFALPDIDKKIQEINRDELGEIKTLAFPLAQISLSALAKVRTSSGFHECLSAIYKASPETWFARLRDYLHFVGDALKMNIKSFPRISHRAWKITCDENTRDVLEEIGLSWDQLFRYTACAGAMVIGELVQKRLEGIPLLGHITTFALEPLSDKFSPGERDLKQIIALLGQASKVVA